MSSGSSDGEVVTLHQAQVVVHVSADATPTEGEAGQGGRTSRRRTSVDSTDRSVAASLIHFIITAPNCVQVVQAGFTLLPGICSGLFRMRTRHLHLIRWKSCAFFMADDGYRCAV